MLVLPTTAILGLRSLYFAVAGLMALFRYLKYSLVLILEQIPMSEVRAIAAQYDYNGFPVVTRDGRLVGIATGAVAGLATVTPAS